MPKKRDDFKTTIMKAIELKKQELLDTLPQTGMCYLNRIPIAEQEPRPSLSHKQAKAGR